MDSVNFNQYESASEGAVSKTFMARVFTWMFVALGVTALTSYLFASTPSLFRLLVDETGAVSSLFYIAVFAPLAFVLVINFGFERLSFEVITGLFMAYALVMGISLSVILRYYAGAIVFQAFLVSSASFGAMAVLGYTTNTDLTKLGSILYIALFGVIIASIFSIFTGGDTFIIDVICVIIFTGLTAYKVQMLKNLGAQATDETHGKKMAIWGAMSLYITFINLFLTILRLVGRRR